ncbi:MAG TPA: hypothetical protein VE077_17685 [Candidatus Methylomirabilis sp.]|nr:hypothetical protein [Candidatus Methylomirabilis sp.]
MSDTGNPLLEQPPTTVTVKDVTDQEVDPRKRALLEALGQKDAGIFNALWAARGAHITDAPGLIVRLIVGILDEILAGMGKLFEAAQGEKNAGFYDLAAKVVTDLTGAPVDAAALKNSTFGSGRLAGMETLGGSIYDLLESEFKPQSGDLEAGDDAAAKKFLGFLMNFAIRQGNIETILSLIPEEYRFLDGFREYGELMAKNLGLGRMARRALQPLIQVLVADPLMYKLQEQYRPKRIGAMPAIKKFLRDQTFEQQMRKELGQEGYTDDRINDLIEDIRPLLSARELIEFEFRTGLPGLNTGSDAPVELAQLLGRHGYTPNDMSRLITVTRPLLKENEIGLLFANGLIDQSTASLHMAKLGYDDDTAKLALQAHSLQHHHARFLGLAELKKAFHNSVIDLLELKAKLSSQGYSDDDIQIITLDLLQPTHGKVRQLSLAEIKAGFKAGVLTEQQAAEHLKTLGYSDDDVAVILKTLPTAKAAAPAAAPSSQATVPTAGAQGVPRAPE